MFSIVGFLPSGTCDGRDGGLEMDSKLTGDLASLIERRLTGGWVLTERLTQATLGKAFRGELVPTEAELAQQEERHHGSATTLIHR